MSGKQNVAGELPRRDFMRGAAAATAAFTILPGLSYGRPRRISANDKVNIAAVGVGGRGRSVMQAMASQNRVAMCDVDRFKAYNDRFGHVAGDLVKPDRHRRA